MVRVLAVSDSDSYLKWSSATLRALPAEWHTEQVVLATPITPSPAQVLAAAGAAVPVVSSARLAWKVIKEKPDVVLLSCTGPVVEAILGHPYLRYGRHRPVLVTGLPGISVPATRKAVRFRACCDLFVVHSHREREEFSEIASVLAPGLVFGLARLPFLHQSRHSDGATRDTVVFAAQAKVPADREHRRQVLLALAQSPSARPAVVKLRAWAGEEQTHRETWPYPQLWAELVAEGKAEAHAVRFSGGSMADALNRAAGFVTVSSTAALEAIAAGIPLVVISDFGVSAEMINTVFQKSEALGTLDDLRNGRFFTPDRQWCSVNYFHRAEESDWLDLLGALLAERGARGLPSRPLRRVSPARARLRRQARVMLPRGLWPALSRARRSYRRLPLTGWTPAPDHTAPARPPSLPAGTRPLVPQPGPPDARREPQPASQRLS